MSAALAVGMFSVAVAPAEATVQVTCASNPATTPTSVTIKAIKGKDRVFPIGSLVSYTGYIDATDPAALTDLKYGGTQISRDVSSQTILNNFLSADSTFNASSAGTYTIKVTATATDSTAGTPLTASTTFTVVISVADSATVATPN